MDEKNKQKIKFIFFALIITFILVFVSAYFYLFFSKRMNRLSTGIVAKDLLVGEDRTTRAVFVEKFVNEAAKYIRSVDLKDKQVQDELSGDRWRVWDYYIFAYTMKDFLCLVHGANSDRIGKSFKNERNILGHYITFDVVKAVDDPNRRNAWFSYYWKNPADIAPKLKYAFLKYVKDAKGLDVVVGSGFYSSMPFPYVETFYQLGELLERYKGKLSNERFSLLREAVDILNTTKNIFLTTYSNKSIDEFFATILHSQFVKANIKISYFDGDELLASVGSAKDSNKIFELQLEPQFDFTDELTAVKQKDRSIVLYLDS